MNAGEIHDILKELAKQPIHLLGSRDIISLGSTLSRFLNKIESVQYWSKIEEMLSTIRSNDTKLFNLILKERDLKKPAKSARGAQLERYYEMLKSAIQEYETRSGKLAALVKKIAILDDESALKQISRLSADERKELSLYAGVTKRTTKGAAPLNLGASRNTNLLWLAEIRNNKLHTILDR